MDEEQRHDSEDKPEPTHETTHETRHEDAHEQTREQSTPQEPEQHEYKPQKHSPTVVHIKKRRPILHLFLMLLLVGATAGVGYKWYDTNEQLVAERSKVAALQNEQDAFGTPEQQAEAEAEQDEIPSFNKFISAYNAFFRTGPDDGPLPEDVDNEDVLAAVAEYYQVASLDPAASVLVAYQTVKPGSEPTGDISALVYVPASEDKPAGFVDVFKASGGEWAVFVDGM